MKAIAPLGRSYTEIGLFLALKVQSVNYINGINHISHFKRWGNRLLTSERIGLRCVIEKNNSLADMLISMFSSAL